MNKVKNKSSKNPKKSKNPKAFSFNSSVRARMSKQRAADIQQKKLHSDFKTIHSKKEKTNQSHDSLSSLSHISSPPLLVGFVGPEGVGKNILLRSILKYYSSYHIPSQSRLKGPITATINKSKRFTFLICPDEINAMIDFSKVVDVVLLVIDAKKGFEMSHFEFLNMCQIHGFPIIIGVLTHLDQFTSMKTLQNRKKQLKKRFWTEIYDGAKLLYLSYIINLYRCISHLSPPHLHFRNSHPFLVCDRFEDMTPSHHIHNNPQCNRSICLYGYLRGCQLLPSRLDFHFLGVGDIKATQFELYSDPCPLFDKTTHRSLRPKISPIYAPMADWSDVFYDKDALFIQIPSHQIDYSDPSTLEKPEEITQLSASSTGVTMVQTLHNLSVPLDQQSHSFKIFTNSIPLDDSHEDINIPSSSTTPPSESNYSKYPDSTIPSKLQSINNNNQLPSISSRKIPDLMEMIYDNPQIDKKYNSLFSYLPDYDEGLVINYTLEELNEFRQQETLQNLKNQYFTHSSISTQDDALNDNFSNDEEEIDDDIDDNDLSDEDEEDEELNGDNDEKDNDFLNKDVNTPQIDSVPNIFSSMPIEDRFSLEGYPVGSYLRIHLSLPPDFVSSFDLSYPLILGSLNVTETLPSSLPHHSLLSILECRVKLHRWSPKILKANDPLYISCGWRRYQTLPLYSIIDPNKRYRYLKYTPRNLHCIMMCTGPKVPPGTGILATHHINEFDSNFRISLTGVVTTLHQTSKVVKKLKLVGEPLKIYKNTAIIKNMFHSDIEVAKYLGASIRTVSGVRGMIKKIQGPEGYFRATFEDKIVYNDIVFCRTWSEVSPTPFFDIVSNLLLPEKNVWKGMRSLRQIRLDNKTTNQTNNITTSSISHPLSDHIYQPITRLPPSFSTFSIPPSLLQNLPFSARPKLMSKINKNSYIKKRQYSLSSEERLHNRLYQQIYTVRREKILKEKMKEEEKKTQNEKINKKQSLLLHRQQQERKKRYLQTHHVHTHKKQKTS